MVTHIQIGFIIIRAKTHNYMSVCVREGGRGEGGERRSVLIINPRKNQKPQQ